MNEQIYLYIVDFNVHGKSQIVKVLCNLLYDSIFSLSKSREIDTTFDGPIGTHSIRETQSQRRRLSLFSKL